MADFSVIHSTRKDSFYKRHEKEPTKKEIRKNRQINQFNQNSKKVPKHIKTKIGLYEKKERVAEKFDFLDNTISDMENYIMIDGKIGFVPEDHEIPTCPGCVLELYDYGDYGLKYAFEKKYGKIPIDKFIIEYYENFHNPKVRICVWCVHNIYYLNGLDNEDDEDYENDDFFGLYDDKMSLMSIIKIF